MKLISYKDWESLTLKLGGELWEGSMPLPKSKLVFSTCDWVDQLFRDILENQDYNNQFILVSSASDFGPDYNTRKPYKDIQRWQAMDPNIWDKNTGEALGHHDLIIRSRHEKTRCLARDKFCMRAYSWVSSTFPVIPKQIKNWLVTNCNIEDSRIIHIPFGVSPDSIHILEELHDQTNPNKTGKPVACWTNYTNERQQLQQMLNERDFYKTKCTPTELFQHMLNAPFVLCPEGNGLDSYRILECLYLGTHPIILCNGYDTQMNWIKAYDEITPIQFCNISKTYDLLGHLTFSSSIPRCSEFLYLEAWESLILQLLGE